VGKVRSWLRSTTYRIATLALWFDDRRRRGAVHLIKCCSESADGVAFGKRSPLASPGECEPWECKHSVDRTLRLGSHELSGCPRARSFTWMETHMLFALCRQSHERADKCSSAQQHSLPTSSLGKLTPHVQDHRSARQTCCCSTTTGSSPLIPHQVTCAPVFAFRSCV
jgi:hypothetical protein